MPKASPNYRMAVVSHVFATGPAHALVEYLRRKGQAHLFIGHPFHKHPPEPSFCLRTEAGGGIRRIVTADAPPEPYRFLLDFLHTLWWLARFGPLELVIGCGNMNAFAGLVMRRFGRVRRVVFYAIDYVPSRFDQPALNAVYHWLDRMCARHCDSVWNLSPAMAQARERADPGIARRAPSAVAPMGAGFDLARRPRPSKDAATIAFVGHLLEKQGVQVALQALPLVLQAVPEARLLVMGTGPHEAAVRALATQLGVNEHVEFTGFVADFQLVQQRLAASTIGVAPYLGELDRFTRFADPGKLKDYLAAALPVVTTDVPPIARVIEARGAGLVVEQTAPALAAALIALLTDRVAVERMSAAAFTLAQEYDWERVFGAAFASLRPAFALAGGVGGEGATSGDRSRRRHG